MRWKLRHRNIFLRNIGGRKGYCQHTLYNNERTGEKLILDDGIRPDNRKHDEIRPIWVVTGVLPRCHGTGLFKRGQTQALSVATLGPVREGQRLDGISEETEKSTCIIIIFRPIQ
jgi:polyribonucleotide nucleotidyltransferase